MKFAGASLLTLPLCFAAYGVIRLIGRMDGHYGPGFAWQAGHLVNLAGLLLFVPALLALRRVLPRTRGRNAAIAVTLVGVATSVVQFTMDVVAGLLAADRPGMNEITSRFTGIPGIRPLIYVVGPPLLYVGLLALLVVVARAGTVGEGGERTTVAWWSPALVLVGSVLTIVSLDLIPVAGLCLLVALVPLARLLWRQSGPAQVLPDAHTRSY